MVEWVLSEQQVLSCFPTPPTKSENFSSVHISVFIFFFVGKLQTKHHHDGQKPFDKAFKIPGQKRFDNAF